jgi:hypothetical protein
MLANGYIDYSNLIIVLAVMAVIVSVWRFVWKRYL